MAYEVHPPSYKSVLSTYRTHPESQRYRQGSTRNTRVNAAPAEMTVGYVCTDGTRVDIERVTPEVTREPDPMPAIRGVRTGGNVWASTMPRAFAPGTYNDDVAAVADAFEEAPRIPRATPVGKRYKRSKPTVNRVRFF